MYDCEDKVKMFDHIRKCKGRKDIITTRWLTKEQLSKPIKEKPCITIETVLRPVTR
tara:strand:- start:66 stop:233 length:168 start_codon:yes stop_codon:yes gene_type:complete